MSAGTTNGHPKAWDVRSLAERWGCSTTFVYEQIKCGKLAHFKLGAKLYRISQRAVEDYECHSPDQ